jgi:hypothetical protein
MHKYRIRFTPTLNTAFSTRSMVCNSSVMLGGKKNFKIHPAISNAATTSSTLLVTAAVVDNHHTNEVECA